eukprot:s949_g2.t1
MDESDPDELEEDEEPEEDEGAVPSSFVLSLLLSTVAEVLGSGVSSMAKFFVSGVSTIANVEAVPLLKIAQLAEELPSTEVALALVRGVGAILDLGQNIHNGRSGGLVLQVRSTTPEYKGFRFSFASGTLSPSYACAGGGSIPMSRGCFKAKFQVPKGSNFTEVRIPWRDFSDKWSPATGEQTTTCAEDASVCPTAQRLAGIKRIEVWAEGAVGHIHLEVKSISARSTAVPPAFNTCRSPIQRQLRYNIASRTEPTVPVPVDPSESLAEAICCDNRTKVYAEPQFLYQAPDIALFDKISGTTTFYDSACGVPLFKAPVNRSMADFKADTDEHGWPSFRKQEVFSEHVSVDKNGFVYSSCGTHLGSYLPDSTGPRYCMDLSCIAGNPVQQII